MDAEKINKDNLNEVTGGNGPMTPEEERTMRIWNRAVYFKKVLICTALVNRVCKAYN